MSGISKKLMQAAAGQGGAGSSFLAVGHEGSPNLTLLNHSSGSLSLASTYSASDRSRSVSFNSDNSHLAVGCGLGTNVGGNGSECTVLSLSQSGSISLEDTYIVSTDGSRVYSVAFSPDGNNVATGYDRFPYFTFLSFNGSSLSLASTYNLATELFDSPGNISFNPNENYVGVTHKDATSVSFTLLDYSNPGSVTLADTYSRSNAGLGCSFSPDGDYIAAAYDNSPDFFLLDHTTPGSVSLSDTYELPRSTAYDVSFSPLGDKIAVAHGAITSSNTGLTVLTHSAGSVSLSTTYYNSGTAGSGQAVSFSADGNYIAWAPRSSGDVYIFDATGGSLVLTDTYNVGNFVLDLEFSPI